MNKKAPVTVVGSNMVDLSSFLERFPEQGETVFGRDFIQGFGGKGANQAIMASILGSDVGMVTCVGNDLFGPEWLKEFEKNDVNTEFIKVIDGNYSGVAAIWVEPSGDNRIVLGAGANDDVTPTIVKEAFENLPSPNVVLSQLEIPQETILAGFKQGKRLGSKNILNPGPASVVMQEIMDITDWILPNETEFALLAKEMYELPIEDFNEAVKKFGDLSGINIVVTHGEEGAKLYMPNKDKEVAMFPALNVDAKDTTGAGDAFCGAFAHGISKGLSPEKSIELANVLAGDSVKRTGTQVSYARGEQLKMLLNEIITFDEK